VPHSAGSFGWKKVKGTLGLVGKIIIHWGTGEKGGDPALRHTTCFTLFSVNITKYAAFNLSQSAERLVAGSSGFAAKDESLSEHLFFIRIRSGLRQIKSKLSARIEANVSTTRPTIAMVTSHTLLKERTLFLERLQQALR
jgi:hypothetical protein